MVDKDIDIYSVEDVIWAISTRADPVRDTVLVENTPIDYLDFASPEPGLGGKMGIDATNKIPPETARDCGRPAGLDKKTEKRVEELARMLGGLPESERGRDHAAELVAGPEIRKTSAAPGDRPAWIRPRAIGVEAVAQTYRGMPIAIAAIIGHRPLPRYDSSACGATTVAMSPEITTPKMSALPMSRGKVTKP